MAKEENNQDKNFEEFINAYKPFKIKCLEHGIDDPIEMVALFKSI